MRAFGLQVLGGVRAFLPTAIFWAVVATFMYSFADDPQPERHESLPSLLTLYFTMALSGGMVFGALRKWATTDLRFAVMSVAVAMPLAASLLLMVNGWQLSAIAPWEVLAFVVFAILLGPPFGFYARTLYSGKDSSAKRDA